MGEEAKNEYPPCLQKCGYGMHGDFVWGHIAVIFALDLGLYPD